MIRYISILFIPVAGLMMACVSSKKAALKKANKFYQDTRFLAWNEDTVNSYQFALTKDNEFFYTIIKKDSSKETREYYYGTISSKSSFDTLFLDYYKSRKPYGAKNYLVREASGTYLIQSFDNNSKRIFLRKLRFGNRY